jgi:uncharacterized protein (DUF362 family)
MDRRQFIRQVMLFSAGFTFTIPRFSISDAFAAAPSVPDIASVKGLDYAKVVKEVVNLLGGMEHFVRFGDKVVVKPNIGWDRSPDQAANTHPLVVRTLVELALEAGASEVKVFDHTCNEKRRCYKNSGIADAVKSLKNKKARLEYIDKRKFVPVDIADGVSLTRWDIYKEALTADCYINVPVAKHHGLSRLTLGLKNSMGVIGGNRGRLHQDLGQNLADLATVVKPQLTVIDATRMLMKNGPQGGRLSDVTKKDTVIASADPVATDALATTLFGLAPEDISSTVAAHLMGLGQIDLGKMNHIQRTL